MDFVLNSSDSEYADSPRVSKTRPGMRHRDLSPLTPDTGNVTSGVKIENGRLYLGDSRRAAITRSELQAVYDKLDTPRASTTHALGPTRGDGTRPGGSILRAPITKGKNIFDASKERMKLANIIDSETNADDTADSLFLRPITMQGPLENTPKRLISDSGSSGSALKRSHTHDLDPLDAKFSDFSDAEDLLAEFSKPSFSRVEGQKPPRLAPVDDSSALPGRLLHVDSTSEHSTPRYQSIRDELDQSRTRFRQSINALLNSSPISVPRTLQVSRSYPP